MPRTHDHHSAASPTQDTCVTGDVARSRGASESCAPNASPSAVKDGRLIPSAAWRGVCMPDEDASGAGRDATPRAVLRVGRVVRRSSWLCGRADHRSGCVRAYGLGSDFRGGSACCASRSGPRVGGGSPGARVEAELIVDDARIWGQCDRRYGLVFASAVVDTHHASRCLSGLGYPTEQRADELGGAIWWKHVGSLACTRWPMPGVDVISLPGLAPVRTCGSSRRPGHEPWFSRTTTPRSRSDGWFTISLGAHADGAKPVRLLPGGVAPGRLP